MLITTFSALRLVGMVFLNQLFDQGPWLEQQNKSLHHLSLEYVHSFMGGIMLEQRKKK